MEGFKAEAVTKLVVEIVEGLRYADVVGTLQLLIDIYRDEPSEEVKVADFARKMRAGDLNSLKPGEFGVAIGKELANQLLLRIGDRLTLIAPQGTLTPAGLVPRLRQFTIVAIFESGHYEYDTSLVLMNIEDAAKLFRVDGVSGVRLKTTDMYSTCSKPASSAIFFSG